MGWGLQKSEREKVLHDTLVTASAPGPEARNWVAVADMNAKIRQKAVDIKSSAVKLSLWRIVKNVVKEVSKNARHVVLIFDSPQSMPAIRELLWKRRYSGVRAGDPLPKRDMDATLEWLDAAAHTTVAAKAEPPQRYAELFAPGQLKLATWTAIENIARRIAAMDAARDGFRATVVGRDHSVFDTHPDEPAVEVPRWGEADLKAYKVAKDCNSSGVPTVLHSVDTDLILQAVATVGGDMQSAAWTPPAPFIIALKNFRVDAVKLIARFGGASPLLRLETVFWFIMAGGTDYTKPASDQGYAKRALCDLAHPANLTSATVSPWTSEGPANARTKLRLLRGTRKVARTVCGKAKKSGRNLKQALKQAAATTLYYGLLDVEPNPAIFAA